MVPSDTNINYDLAFRSLWYCLGKKSNLIAHVVSLNQFAMANVLNLLLVFPVHYLVDCICCDYSCRCIFSKLYMLTHQRPIIDPSCVSVSIHVQPLSDVPVSVTRRDRSRNLILAPILQLHHHEGVRKKMSKWAHLRGWITKERPICIVRRNFSSGLENADPK